MTTSTKPQPQPQAAQETVRIDGRLLADLVNKICEAHENELERSVYFRRCFELVCVHFEAVAGIINVRQGGRTMEQKFRSDDVSSSWLAEADAIVLRTQTDNASLTRAFKDRNGHPIVFALGTPITSSNGNAFGGISLVVAQKSEKNVQAMLAQLIQLVELIIELAPIPHQTTSNKSDGSGKQTLKSIIKASDYHSIQHLSFAIVNSLCERLGCEQVVLGLARRNDIQLLAVSGMDEIPKNTPGMNAIQQSMAVCLDRRDFTVVQKKNPSQDQLPSSTCHVHHFWHRMTAGAAVATIPLFVGEECVAVLGIRRQESRPFLNEDIERARVLAQSFAPALPLVDRASRSLIHHLADSVQWGAKVIFSWKRLGIKLALTLMLAAMIWVCFGKQEYRVLASCKIVPDHINVISAPFEGKVAEVLVSPGQRVSQGEILARMDTRDLLLELRRVSSEIASTRIEKDALLREKKPNEAFLKLSEIEVLQTDQVRIREQLQRAEIRASESGTILPTEIHRNVGQFVTLGEELLEIAAERDWRLEVNASESDSTHVIPGQAATFQSYARPDQAFNGSVLQIHPAASVVDQKNVVIVDVKLLEREDWMRVGMEGSVRITTEPQPIWWIYAHPVLDYLRLKLWL